MKLALVRPQERYRESVVRGLRELRDEGLPWHVAVDLTAIERDFAAFVASKLADVKRDIPATHLWAIADDEFVGRLSIRHALNDALRIEGGHIGYDTVPSFRGRGVATEMLRQALPIARTLGLTSVLLTCDDTNARSIRVIERNGGVLTATKELAPNRPLKRYYEIDLTQQEPPTSSRSTTSP
ncbi:MAG: GNAT family N-acetyltransferase [Myxococcales bacterium]|nr:GNAT family N-acetyltransferase [Myxococcales bacterium]